MAFNLFGSKKPKVPQRDMVLLTRGLTSPAVQLVKADARTRSYVGGQPDLPSSVPWPTRGKTPLGFLASVDLGELRQVIDLEWLPEAGSLLFFYDIENQPWGFDPKHRDGWAVLFLPAAAAAIPESAAVGGRSPPHRYITFKPIDTYPSYERDSIASLQLTDEELDALIELQGAQYQKQPQHHMGGFPAPVQGDEMERECQLVSNGVYCGDDTGSKDPRAAELSKSASDWKLLLQFDSDDDMDMMWGDGGKLYFWVREQDARRGHFAGVWLVLQCF